MTKVRKIGTIGISLLTIIVGILILIMGIDGFQYMILLISISFIISGLHQLFYYVTMARKMVGGKSILVRGLLTLDIGVFFLTKMDNPVSFIILYILGYHLLAGVVDVLKVLENRRMGVSIWGFNLFYGIANIAFAIICLICILGIGNVILVTYLYGLWLLFTAVIKIVSVYKEQSAVIIE